MAQPEDPFQQGTREPPIANQIFFQDAMLLGNSFNFNQDNFNSFFDPYGLGFNGIDVQDDFNETAVTGNFTDVFYEGDSGLNTRPILVGPAADFTGETRAPRDNLNTLDGSMISKEDWEGKKGVLYQLYITENHTMKELEYEMTEIYHFKAT